jgi:hypothetical protein
MIKNLHDCAAKVKATDSEVTVKSKQIPAFSIFSQLINPACLKNLAAEKLAYAPSGDFQHFIFWKWVASSEHEL